MACTSGISKSPRCDRQARSPSKRQAARLKEHPSACLPLLRPLKIVPKACSIVLYLHTNPQPEAQHLRQGEKAQHSCELTVSSGENYEHRV